MLLSVELLHRRASTDVAMDERLGEHSSAGSLVAMDVPSQATSHECEKVLEDVSNCVPELGSRRLDFVRLPDE